MRCTDARFFLVSAAAVKHTVSQSVSYFTVPPCAHPKHTTRTLRSPAPQARGPLSQWTEAWPTQPAITQAVNRRMAGEGITLLPNVTR